MQGKRVSGTSVNLPSDATLSQPLNQDSLKDSQPPVIPPDLRFKENRDSHTRPPKKKMTNVERTDSPERKETGLN